MYIKVTSVKTERPFLINMDKVYCIVGYDDGCKIIYTDDTDFMVSDSISSIERQVIPQAQVDDAKTDPYQTNPDCGWK